MRLLAFAACLAACGSQPTTTSSPSPSTTPHWVASWAAAIQPVDSDEPAPAVADVTFREVVHLSLGGTRLRLRLSNAYGKTPLSLGSVHVALHGNGSAIQPNSDREVRFAGSKSVAIPVGQSRDSDAIDLVVPAFADVVISFYIAAPGVLTSVHSFSLSTSYTIAGDQTDAAQLPSATTSTSWHVIAGVDVDAAPGAVAIVAFGDSITDGVGATAETNRRWPDRLAVRLRDSGRSVVNAGIAGNALVSEVVGDTGVSRFTRDALRQAGVGYAIVLIGINDLGTVDHGKGKSADEVIAGYRTLIAQAHAAGVKVIGATLIPFQGSPLDTPDAEANRARVNDWIRERDGLDGMIDFDKVVRDPDSPLRIATAFDSGDHLHPSDAGYQAMADAIDLGLLR